SEFKTTNGEAPKNIPVNAYEIEKVTLVETGETNINDEGVYLQNKDLPEEISFFYEDHVMAKRYRLAGVSYCNGSHHVADIYFEKTKNVDWYQYDRLEKTYRARAMYIGCSHPSLKNG
ncbi:12727_t:CDS:2, partial [Ambispora gerdemannii]